MDEMKVKLTTKFMRNIVSKLMARAIYKKFGYKVDVQLNDLDIKFIDGDTKVDVNLEMKLDNKEFMKIIKDVGLD